MIKSIREVLDKAYEEIICWQKNLFTTPLGKEAKTYIKELTRLFNLFNYDTKWKDIALSMIHVFIPLMNQKPAPKSRAKDNAKYLGKRLLKWANGDIEALLKEAREIQGRLKSKSNQISEKKKKLEQRKAFCRLMVQGKISKALKYIDNDEDAVVGVLQITEDLIDTLKKKHPDGLPADLEALINPVEAEFDPPTPAIFEEIGADDIIRYTRKISGSGGPTGVDAEHWVRIICSQFYGSLSTSLAQSIADFSKIYCTQHIKPDSLKEFLAGRMVALDKNPGVRPIGVGEVLRRIVSKAVTTTLNADIQRAAGNLQTCSGLQSGIEAAIHSMRKTFEDDSSEAILLVDADNAFNRLNRKVTLKNIQVICPAFYRFVHNSYQTPVKLFLSGSKTGEFIWSKEGATQGDPAAMAMYALGIRPMMDKLAEVLDDTTKQSWYADDAAACGRLQKLKDWWTRLSEIGPGFGYFPKPSKTVLIVKDLKFLPTAKSLFHGTGIKITLEGDRHLGAVIGSFNFKESFVKKKIEGWVRDVEQLAEFGREEPQLAYSAYTKALCMRWTYVQRTISGISLLFQPLEDAIRDKLLPAIIGRDISDLERQMLALPLRFGGIGIQNPVLISDREYLTSVQVTKQLTELIYQQDNCVDKLDIAGIKATKAAVKLASETRYKAEFTTIADQLNDDQKTFLNLACGKGASSFLSCLPLESAGYIFNKVEFRDSLCVRYNWPLPDIPRFCACGEKTGVDHSCVCKLGGLINMRHDNVRDVEAEFLKEVCREVRTEPGLLPVEPENFDTGAKTGDMARLDIVATGLFGNMEKTFFDVRVTHPNAPSYYGMTEERLHELNEKEKNDGYLERCLQSEKSGFIPLVYSTTGGTGPACEAYHKRLAILMAAKRKDSYPAIIDHIRTKVRFTVLKSIVMGIRGFRKKSTKYTATPTSLLSFELIPEMKTYECL